MLKRIAFVTGVAVGYVLGSKAGRERYEQLLRLGRSVRDNRAMQETVGMVQGQATAALDTARHVAAEQLDQHLGDKPLAHKVAQRLRSDDSGEDRASSPVIDTTAGPLRSPSDSNPNGIPR
jgi:hypothetical protein